MGEFAIRADGLSKCYRIGRRWTSDSLRETLMGALASPFRPAARPGGVEPGEEGQDGATLWALRDVSFEVRRGEIVGVIGRNGAGKSTLLKILTRITAPTCGHAEIRGRVGALLEVGTGFQPELSGRDNIYLSGAILGMRWGEIRRRFNAIVTFAELERFIDTPVKRYSSGMYMRLAFAVAAHLEPEILIVDEVLAVGDGEFQKRCLGKIEDVSRGQGRTVLFVSHNIDAIQRLCGRSMLLDRGRLVADGATAAVVERYLARPSAAGPGAWIDVSRAARTGTGGARFVAAQYRDPCRPAAHPHADGPVEFLLAISSDTARTVGSLAVILYDRSGRKLLNADTVTLDLPVNLRHGRNVVGVRVESLHLKPGGYVLGLYLADPLGATFDDDAVLDSIEGAFEIEVVDLASRGFGATPQFDGVVTCRFDLFDATSHDPAVTTRCG